jgi:hypothetical protein
LRVFPDIPVCVKVRINVIAQFELG